MQDFIKADIFFFVTSIMVIVLIVIFVFVGYYLMQILRNFRDISNKLKKASDIIEDDLEDIHGQITESWIYKLLFKTKNKKHKKTH